MDPQIFCNDTCCTSISNVTFCFADNNFTSRQNLTYPTDAEIAVRYAISIPLMLMGVIGNSLTIFLLMKNNLMMRTSVNCFIFNMAVADLFHSLNGPVPYTLQELNQFWILGRYWCYAQTYIQVQVQLVSMTSIAVISFDRMLGIVRPFHGHLTKRQSLIIIFIIWIYASAFATPFTMNSIYTEHQWKDILERICCFKDKNLHVWFLVLNIGSFWIPLIIMVLCYGTIFYNFKKYTRKKKEHPASLHMKRRVLRMLVCLTLIVIICWVPLQALEIAESELLDGDGNFKDDYTSRVYKIMANISQYLVYVTPAVNPIVYALMHQNFRRAYRTTFTCCFKGKPRYRLSKSDGSRPFMWSVRNGVTAFANSISSIRQKRRRSRIDTRKISFAVQNNSYGNTLTIPGLEPHPNINSTNGTNCIVSESVYPKKISNAENKPTSKCYECNSIIEENPSEEMISENNNYIINPSFSSLESSFKKQNKLNDIEKTSDRVSNAEVEPQSQPDTDNANGYVNTFNVLNDERSLNDSPDVSSL